MSQKLTILFDPRPLVKSSPRRVRFTNGYVTFLFSKLTFTLYAVFASTTDGKSSIIESVKPVAETNDILKNTTRNILKGESPLDFIVVTSELHLYKDFYYLLFMNIL